MKIGIPAIVVSMIVIIRCTAIQPAIDNVRIGSSINEMGHISNTSTLFRFPRYKKEGRVSDLFNYIYFKGDGIFISCSVVGYKALDSVSVKFIEPSSGRSFPAERIDIKEETKFFFFTSQRLYGFSLVGSILEDFYEEQLSEPVPENQFCCRDIPFIVRVDIPGEKGTISKEIKSSFKILYTE